MDKKEYKRRRQSVIRKLKILGNNKVFGKGAKNDIDYLLRRLPPLSRINTTRDYNLAVRELERAEQSNMYSVRGRYRSAGKAIGTLRGYGVNIKTVGELQDFGAFMERMREFSLGRVFDSTKAADVWSDNKGESHGTLEKIYRDWSKSHKRDFSSGK